MRYLATAIAFLGMGVLCAPVFGENPARPGTVNYVEGAVFLEGRQLNQKDVGSLAMNPGEVLSTAAGKAEILLTPGVFLRLDDRSAVKMISPDITPTQVELEQGRASVEVDELYPQNNLEIVDAGVTTRLVKTGFYEFDANPVEAQVFRGKAAVEVGDGKYRVVKDHHELALNAGPKIKPENFVARGIGDDLYNWSSLRSQYLAEANNQIAGEYAGVSGFNPGWYWDPYMWDYTFIGMGPYWSPFGFGFYPPWGWYGGGWYGGGGYYGGGFNRGGYRGGGGFRGDGGFRGGGGGGGFHGVSGGGFHGGGGGGRR
jgi:hypothetical protein